jgi:hypothetical protein
MSATPYQDLLISDITPLPLISTPLEHIVIRDEVLDAFRLA